MANKYNVAFERIADPQFMRDVADLEKKYTWVIDKIGVGVLYCKKGQSEPFEMFTNRVKDLTDDAVTFFSLLHLGEMESDTYPHTFWEKREYIWYFAPTMNQDTQRTYIGNVNVVLIFNDEGIPFDAKHISKLGAMIQVVLVVQPHGSSYRVGCIHKKNLHDFTPYVLPNHIFSAEHVVPYILAKLHNGQLHAHVRPPLDTLFIRPRAVALETLIETYDKTTRGKWLKK